VKSKRLPKSKKEAKSMSSWYNSSWFSANEVQAWTPGASNTTTAKGPGKVVKGTNHEITNLKQAHLSGKLDSWNELKPQNNTTKVSGTGNNNDNKTRKITENGLLPPPSTNSLSFFELPTNAATHQGAWDAYVITEPTPKPSPQLPPSISSEEFSQVKLSDLWEPPTQLPNSPEIEKSSCPESPCPESTCPDSPKDFQLRPKRNIDIEAELNRQNLYKTELCQSWGETGTCRYGTKCQFAHGSGELRPVLRHPKYKTEICKTFNTLGTCPYGKRCRFVHHASELRSPSADLEPEFSAPAEDPEITAEIQRKLNDLNLGLLAPDPVFQPDQSETPENPSEREGSGGSSVSVKKGSRLPFFQKLRKQKW